jgi:hypothetical protein
MPQYPAYVSVARAKSFYGITVIPSDPTTGAPVVNPATYQLVLPVTSAQAVGTVVGSNTPTAWAITSGGEGNYAISSGGAITVTSAGATGINVGTDYLLVTATNASGSGQAVITIETT